MNIHLTHIYSTPSLHIQFHLEENHIICAIAGGSCICIGSTRLSLQLPHRMSFSLRKRCPVLKLIGKVASSSPKSFPPLGVYPLPNSFQNLADLHTVYFFISRSDQQAILCLFFCPKNHFARKTDSAIPRQPFTNLIKMVARDQTLTSTLIASEKKGFCPAGDEVTGA